MLTIFVWITETNYNDFLGRCLFWWWRCWRSSYWERNWGAANASRSGSLKKCCSFRIINNISFSGWIESCIGGSCYSFDSNYSTIWSCDWNERIWPPRRRGYPSKIYSYDYVHGRSCSTTRTRTANSSATKTCNSTHCSGSTTGEVWVCSWTD